MKYIFISKCGESLFLARMLHNLGKEVHFYIDEHSARSLGKGLGFDITDDFHNLLNKIDKKEIVLIFDDTGMGDEADFYKNLGYHVFGAAAINDKIEEDRSYATQLLSKFMPVPPTTSFSSYDEGITFLRKQNKEARYVFKPEGDNNFNSMTYVGKSIIDLVNQIEYYKKDTTLPPMKFELQEFIEGIEMDFSEYLRSDGKVIDDSFEIYMEEKKMMNGNKGVATGCADAIQYFTTKDEPYYKEYMSKFTSFLREHGFNGQFSINNIVSKKDHKPYALEISPRLGYNSSEGEFYLLWAAGKDPSLLIDAVAMNKALPKGYFPQKKFAMSVSITIPPYPFKDGSAAKGQRILMEPDIAKNFMPADVMYNPLTDCLECTGCDGWLGTMTNSGDSIQGVIDDMYKNIMPKLSIANVQYRTDGGARVESDLKTLREWKTIL